MQHWLPEQVVALLPRLVAEANSRTNPPKQSRADCCSDLPHGQASSNNAAHMLSCRRASLLSGNASEGSRFRQSCGGGSCRWAPGALCVAFWGWPGRPCIPSCRQQEYQQHQQQQRPDCRQVRSELACDDDTECAVIFAAQVWACMGSAAARSGYRGAQQTTLSSAGWWLQQQGTPLQPGRLHRPHRWWRQLLHNLPHHKLAQQSASMDHARRPAEWPHP